MRVAFFLKNEVLQSIDWRNLLDGNPGVGGSEYIIALTAYVLSIRSNVDVTLIVQKKSQFPTGLSIAYADNLRAAIDYCEKNGIPYLAFKEYPRWIHEHCFDKLNGKVGLIVWCHNFLSSFLLDYYTKIPSVKSVICVGREQAELYRDHRLFNKIDYIYNGFPMSSEQEKGLCPICHRKNIVTYIGSIVPFKGFHLLAKAWPMILKEVPDAQLYVIGSGQVYDDSKHLGKYGIAEESYENVFMPFLIDGNKNILPSVHFMGRMGTEKIQIIRETKVGVPNPSGDTETFGIGAIEFEIMGCEVVTRRCCGYLDTVYNKRNLYKPRKAKILAKYVVKALKYPTIQTEEFYNNIKQKFDIRQTVAEWERLFEALENGKSKIHDFNHDIPNLTFRWKWVRILYAKINKLSGYRLPCMTQWSENKIIRHINWLRSQRY